LDLDYIGQEIVCCNRASEMEVNKAWAINKGMP
jgi:hypothetical protein